MRIFPLRQQSRSLMLAGFLTFSILYLTGASSYQVNSGANQNITEFSTCKKVTNNHASGKAVFVPTATNTEWTQFYTNPPTGVTIDNCPSGYVFNVTISANTATYNVKAAAITAGWDQVQALIATVTINSGITVYSTSTATPAFASGSTFPVGSSLTIVNNGTIMGMGGNGGAGAGTVLATPPICVVGSAGAAGGPALTVAIATTITNNGAIYGGGGGGGGGGSSHYVVRACSSSSGGGGGGGRGYGTSSGGGVGSIPTCPSNVNPGSAGGNGNSTSAGGGGAGGNDIAIAGSGGSGGNFGAAGSTGGTASGGSYCNFAGGAGGAGGAAVNGNANITWAVTGTRAGAINN